MLTSPIATRRGRLDRLDAFGDRLLCSAVDWLEFIAAVTGGEVVSPRSTGGQKSSGTSAASCSGASALPILGSPFRGWTTPYMGFNLAPTSHGSSSGGPGAVRVSAARPPALEVTDRYLATEDGAGLGLAIAGAHLRDRSDAHEDELFANMSSACRRAIRKSEKSGYRRQAAPEGFAEEYYGHLKDVFAKQDMRPTYSRHARAELIEHVHPSGDLLLARVRDPEGRSIATGIFAASTPSACSGATAAAPASDPAAERGAALALRCAIGSSAGCAA